MIDDDSPTQPPTVNEWENQYWREVSAVGRMVESLADRYNLERVWWNSDECQNCGATKDLVEDHCHGLRQSPRHALQRMQHERSL